MYALLANPTTTSSASAPVPAGTHKCYMAVQARACRYTHRAPSVTTIRSRFKILAFLEVLEHQNVGRLEAIALTH